MTPEVSDPLLPEMELALAWTPAALRDRLGVAFALDRRLARIAARTNEVMLGQMRLAWWRETMAKPRVERPQGDAVLDAIGEHWAGDEAPLIALVDAWEVLMTADPLDDDAIAGFGSQRGAFFGALAERATPEMQVRIADAAFRWAMADAQTGVSDDAERAALIAAGLARGHAGGRLPRALRGLAVLDALAVRSLKAGGTPLMEGRGASLAAIRGAILRA